MAAESGGSTPDAASYNWAILSHTYDHGNENARRGRNERGRSSRRHGKARGGRSLSDNASAFRESDESVQYYKENAVKYGVVGDEYERDDKVRHERTETQGRHIRGTGRFRRDGPRGGWNEKPRRDYHGEDNQRRKGEQELQTDKDASRTSRSVRERFHRRDEESMFGNSENGNQQLRSKGEIIDGKYVPLREDYQVSHRQEKKEKQPRKDNMERVKNGGSIGNQGRGNDRQRRGRFSRKPIDSEQARALIEQLVEESYECMVCCEFLRSSHPSWCCQNCYHIFHLRCIKQWVKSSSASVKGDVSGWRCPGCQNVTEKMPTNYTCFCGKVKNPEWNPRHGIIPHSCGEICKKQRSSPPCWHFCNELCHPGPCPSCPVMVSKECPCGKTRTKMRCGQTTVLKCKNICGKMLNCGKHKCAGQCHEGRCNECHITESQSCFCGKENRERKCGKDRQDVITDKDGNSRYSCKNICSRILDCGNHSCTEVCHPGSCSSCVYLPKNVERCPCKQMRIADLLPPGQMRKSCLDPIPCCTNFCGKKLKCGSLGDEHFCKQPCHTGTCSPCDGETRVPCRCGSTETEIPCKDFDPEKEVLCQRRCNKKRNCVRHRCNQKCCVDVEHSCPLICGRKLSCGLHKCDEPCHQGNCPRCWQTSFEERTCYCGDTIQYPPIFCGTPLPQCTMPCTRPHPCKHEPQHQCHSEDKCPPCVILTEKRCLCNREIRKNIPCHLNSVSCGKPCGKELRCKMHKCVKLCHKGDCLGSEEHCHQPCTISRRDCPHPCGASCHAGEDCPEGPCKSQITVRCKCGRKSEKVLCLAGNSKSQYHRFASEALGDKLRNLRSGESVDLSGLMVAEKRRGLDCDEDCAIFERQKILADAFGIDNPEANHFASTQFSYALKEEAKAQLPFVKQVEDAIEILIQKIKKTSLAQISHSFPPMNSSQRKLIHEIAGFYNCKTISYDPEPKRNTVVTATKESSLINPKLSTVIERKGNRPLPNPVLCFADKPLNFQGMQKKSSEPKLKEAPSVDYFDDDLPE